jgi:hypothetical protein
MKARLGDGLAHGLAELGDDHLFRLIDGESAARKRETAKHDQQQQR